MSTIGRVFGFGAKVKNATQVAQVAQDTVQVAAGAGKAVTRSAGRVASAPKLNYRSKVLHLPERQVQTRFGSYIRTMGEDGRRIYTDANGVQIHFNEGGYNYFNDARTSGYRSHSLMRRVYPNGGHYSVSVESSNVFPNMKLTRSETNFHPLGTQKTRKFEISPEGKVVEAQFDYFSGEGGQFVSRGNSVRYGCPRDGEATMYGWLNHRWSTQAPPQWISLSDYAR